MNETVTKESQCLKTKYVAMLRSSSHCVYEALKKTAGSRCCVVDVCRCEAMEREKRKQVRRGREAGGSPG